MQVTKELIENDIKAMEAQLESAKASINQIIGSLATLRGVKEFLDKPEPVIEASTAISDVNAQVQAELEAAMSLQDVAEMVGGEGAVAEEPVVLPAAGEIWEQQPKVVDGNGMYKEAV